MIVELETGGNVRVEDGKPSDVWYSSCADLVRSRLNLGDLQHAGVRDVSITRVLRKDAETGQYGEEAARFENVLLRHNGEGVECTLRRIKQSTGEII